MPKASAAVYALPATAVNPGWLPACKWLQEALGFQGEAVDGKVGRRTAAAAGKLGGRGLLRVALAVQDRREAYYRARPDYRGDKPFGVRFLPGWLNRVNLTRQAINAAAFSLRIV